MIKMAGILTNEVATIPDMPPIKKFFNLWEPEVPAGAFAYAFAADIF
jgi:hypothetical protein